MRDGSPRHGTARLRCIVRRYRKMAGGHRPRKMVVDRAAHCRASAQNCGHARTKNRQEILDEARSRLESLGAAPKPGERFLYSAANPIGEECFRECNFRIDEDLINEVAVEAAPWIDLWRDSYAFIASRVATGLRRIFEKAPAKNNAVPLAAFLHACDVAELSLTGPGLVGLAVMAFQEVKAAFREQLRPHVDAEEHELSAEDCHLVRRKFEYPQFDEYTYPSADLQLAAKSTDAVARGDYQWILAELYPPVALLHHCMYWSCPGQSPSRCTLPAPFLASPTFISVSSPPTSPRTPPFAFSMRFGSFLTSSRRNAAIPIGTRFVRQTREVYSRRCERGMFACEKPARMIISGPLPAPGSFRSVFIRSNLGLRRIRRACAADV